MTPLLLLAAAAAALPPGPVDYSADETRFAPRDRRIFLDGDVHLARGDLTVTGDHATAELADRQPPAPKKRGRKAANASLAGASLRRFTIDGRVHLARGARTAEGAHGVLDTEAQTMLLTGEPSQNPVLRDGQDVLEGERILIHLESEDVDVQHPRLVLRRGVADARGAAPTRVEAARLVLQNERRLARFTDGVVIRRADAIVRSPRMDARYDQEGQLTDLRLKGGVEVTQGERRATGEEADYDARARQVVLTGDPHLYDRGDVLQGDRIGLSLDTKEVRVEKARGRLRPEAHQNERGAP